jgi:spoIIIJ-associated protein
VNESKYTIVKVGAQIESFLGQVLKSGGFRMKYTLSEGETAHPDFENPEIMVKFSGPDVDLLLANRAELLLALEQLTMEMLRMPSEDHSRISFDANDYRALRIEELRLSAAAAADKVKSTGVPFTFNPMNSRERRVIHLALRNEPAVRSESAGTAAFRHVVIYPAGMPTPASAQAAAAPGHGSPRAPARRGRR